MNEDERRKAIILVDNMIEYNKTMKKIIEQSDSITAEAVKSVLDFSISNLQYLMRLIGYKITNKSGSLSAEELQYMKYDNQAVIDFVERG